MVGIGLDYDGDDWHEPALRILLAGAYLTDVPSRDEVRKLEALAGRHDLELEACETAAGWQVRPAGRQDPD